MEWKSPGENKLLPGKYIELNFKPPTLSDIQKKHEQLVADFDMDALREFHEYSINAGYYENDLGFLAVIHRLRIDNQLISESERRKSVDWLCDNGFAVNEHGRPVKVIWNDEVSE